MRHVKYFLLVVLVLNSCSRKLYIPIENVRLKNQEENFTLGLNKIKVVIQNAQIIPEKRQYIITGYTDFLCTGDKKFYKHPKMPIMKIHNSDTILYTYTKKWGKFKVKMYNNDTILFNVGQLVKDGDTIFYNIGQWKILTIENYCDVSYP